MAYYSLARLGIMFRHVGCEWEFSQSDIVVHKTSGERSVFGYDDTCPWAVEFDVTLGFNPSNATPRKGSIVFIDAYSLIVCSPSFISDSRGIWYFDDDEVRPFIMDKLDIAAVSALAERRLKEYQFRPTEAEPYGNEDDFHEVTKDWLYDADWEDEH